ncbi:hypothetical protein ACFUJY_29645 [Streptomyces sp. NPDC057249]|uniref:hypothetical protein n=1 Tax=Streptomyces sp. NPDC057249 TaxID=3346067 RepID=UPI0036394BF5
MSGRQVCGAAGREAEDGTSVVCDLEPHGPDRDHHAVIIGRYTGEPTGQMWWPVNPPAPAPEPVERLLRIIAETIHEASEGDGADLDDLANRLGAEGFTLPPIR